jgi:transposase
MSRIHLTDSQWAFIAPLLPPPARTGRPRADDRRTIEDILYILITGCRWQDLPREYGAPTTVWRRLKRWGEGQVWERIWRAALAGLDAQGKLAWSMAFLDGSFAPAKNGGDKVGLTKKGKGTKWMLVVDGNGLLLGFHLDSANVAEVKLAEQTLETIRVARRRGRPKRRPEKLVADRGYDSSAFRAALRRRSIRMCIPPKRRPTNWRAKRGRPVVARKADYRLRYRVERFFAWLGNCQRLLMRWERLFAGYRSFFAFAVMLLTVRPLARQVRFSVGLPCLGAVSAAAATRRGDPQKAHSLYHSRMLAHPKRLAWRACAATSAATWSQPLCSSVTRAPPGTGSKRTSTWVPSIWWPASRYVKANRAPGSHAIIRPASNPSPV